MTDNVHRTPTVNQESNEFANDPETCGDLSGSEQYDCIKAAVDERINFLESLQSKVLNTRDVLIPEIEDFIEDVEAKIEADEGKDEIPQAEKDKQIGKIYL